mmetsp:Transcript_20636/g.52279  ORF Transcript_20636/g.52279 Transcript_20636/m.52279 type:complete len:209 (+) Transcript_20636:413-1039(+)
MKSIAAKRAFTPTADVKMPINMRLPTTTVFSAKSLIVLMTSILLWRGVNPLVSIKASTKKQIIVNPSHVPKPKRTISVEITLEAVLKIPIHTNTANNMANNILCSGSTSWALLSGFVCSRAGPVVVVADPAVGAGLAIGARRRAFTPSRDAARADDCPPAAASHAAELLAMPAGAALLRMGGGSPGGCAVKEENWGSLEAPESAWSCV